MALIYSFPTIDLCVDFLESKGCNWNYEKEQILKKNHSFKYKNYHIFYDPHNILNINPY